MPPTQKREEKSGIERDAKAFISFHSFINIPRHTILYYAVVQYTYVISIVPVQPKPVQPKPVQSSPSLLYHLIDGFNPVQPIPYRSVPYQPGKS